MTKQTKRIRRINWDFVKEIAENSTNIIMKRRYSRALKFHNQGWSDAEASQELFFHAESEKT